MKQIKDLKTVLHFKKNNYVYRYVLVDRFKNTSKISLERTEEEIWQLQNDRSIRRKYILKIRKKSRNMINTLFRKR